MVWYINDCSDENQYVHDHELTYTHLCALAEEKYCEAMEMTVGCQQLIPKTKKPPSRFYTQTQINL